MEIFLWSKYYKFAVLRGLKATPCFPMQQRLNYTYCFSDFFDVGFGLLIAECCLNDGNLFLPNNMTKCHGNVCNRPERLQSGTLFLH